MKKIVCAVLILLLSCGMCFQASAEVKTNSARQNIIDYMTAMAVVPWTAGKNFTPEEGPDYIAGKTYYGIPYSQNLSRNITLDLFNRMLELRGGTIGSDIGRNDCSSAVCDALSKAGKTIKITNTRLMIPGAYDLVAVGDYTYTTDKYTTCLNTGKAKMYSCYDLLQPGDVLVTNGHCMLVSGVDPENDRILAIEQTGSYYVFDPVTGTTAAKVTEKDDWNTTWNINGLKTYEELFSKNYIPIASSAVAGIPYQTKEPPVDPQEPAENDPSSERQEPDPPQPVIGDRFGTLGDVNGDGSVLPDDARSVLRAAVGLEEFSAIQKYYGDADNSGGIEPSDARIVLRMAVGLEEIRLK